MKKKTPSLFHSQNPLLPYIYILLTNSPAKFLFFHEHPETGEWSGPLISKLKWTSDFFSKYFWLHIGVLTLSIFLGRRAWKRAGLRKIIETFDCDDVSNMAARPRLGSARGRKKSQSFEGTTEGDLEKYHPGWRNLLVFFTLVEGMIDFFVYPIYNVVNFLNSLTEMNIGEARKGDVPPPLLDVTIQSKSRGDSADLGAKGLKKRRKKKSPKNPHSPKRTDVRTIVVGDGARDVPLTMPNTLNSLKDLGDVDWIAASKNKIKKPKSSTPTSTPANTPMNTPVVGLKKTPMASKPNHQPSSSLRSPARSPLRSTSYQRSPQSSPGSKLEKSPNSPISPSNSSHHPKSPPLFKLGEPHRPPPKLDLDPPKEGRKNRKPSGSPKGRKRQIDGSKSPRTVSTEAELKAVLGLKSDKKGEGAPGTLPRSPKLPTQILLPQSSPKPSSKLKPKTFASIVAGKQDVDSSSNEEEEEEEADESLSEDNSSSDSDTLTDSGSDSDESLTKIQQQESEKHNEDWYILDEVAGVVPKGVLLRWKENAEEVEEKIKLIKAKEGRKLPSIRGR